MSNRERFEELYAKLLKPAAKVESRAMRQLVYGNGASRESRDMMKGTIYEHDPVPRVGTYD